MRKICDKDTQPMLVCTIFSIQIVKLIELATLFTYLPFTYYSFVLNFQIQWQNSSNTKKEYQKGL